MKMIEQLVKKAKRVRALAPSRLPQGLTEFSNWADSIIDIYETPDNDSIRFTLATMVFHLPPTKAYVPKEYFGRALYKAAANEVCSYVIHDLKEKQKAAIAAAQAEATAQLAAAASNEPQI